MCAGSKSILDIGLTLEYLEAHAVPVAGFQTSAWPAFYTADSGFKAPMQLDSATQVAETILQQDRLGLTAALLLGNPIPHEFHAVGDELQRAVDQAVEESVENGMSKSGKLVTPWLLQRVAELSQGKSLESSASLIFLSPSLLSSHRADSPCAPPRRQGAHPQQRQGRRRGRARVRPPPQGVTLPSSHFLP